MTDKEAYRNLRVLSTQFEAFHRVKQDLSLRLGRPLSNSETLSILLWFARIALNLEDPKLEAAILNPNYRMIEKIHQYLKIAFNDETAYTPDAVRGLLDAALIVLEKGRGPMAATRVFEILWTAHKLASEAEKRRESYGHIYRTALKLVRSAARSKLFSNRIEQMTLLLLDIVKRLDDVSDDDLLYLKLEGFSNTVNTHKLVEEISTYYLLNSNRIAWANDGQILTHITSFLCGSNHSNKNLQKITNKLMINPYATINFLGQLLAAAPECREQVSSECEKLLIKILNNEIPVLTDEKYRILGEIGFCAAARGLEEIYKKVLEILVPIVENNYEEINPFVVLGFLPQLVACGAYRGLDVPDRVLNQFKNNKKVMLTIEISRIIGKLYRDELPPSKIASELRTVANQYSYIINVNNEFIRKFLEQLSIGECKKYIFVNININNKIDIYFECDSGSVITKEYLLCPNRFIYDDTIFLDNDKVLGLQFFLPIKLYNKVLGLASYLADRQDSFIRQLLMMKHTESSVYKPSLSMDGLLSHSKEYSSIEKCIKSIIYNKAKDYYTTLKLRADRKCIMDYLASSSTPEELVTRIQQVINYILNYCKSNNRSHKITYLVSLYKLNLLSDILLHKIDKEECRDSYNTLCDLFKGALSMTLRRAIINGNTDMVRAVLALAPRVTCYPSDTSILIEYSFYNINNIMDFDDNMLLGLAKLLKDLGIGMIASSGSPNLYVLILAASCFKNLKKGQDCEEFDLLLWATRTYASRLIGPLARTVGRLIGLKVGLGV